MSLLNETHAPELRSWVASANEPGVDFPIQNLPFGVFRRAGAGEMFRGGVAIGDQIVDLGMAASRGALSPEALPFAAACGAGTLNSFMAMGPGAWSTLRLALSRALRTGAPERELLSACLVPQARAEYTVPAKIGDYTDFYTSIHHATSVGKLFRPDNPLMPNYKWVPIGYHGRASSIQISGTGFTRPVGQTMAPGKAEPDVGPCERLDYELELGIYVGAGNESCTSVPMEQAESHIFGLCLLNDWSARDVQAWEYQPLGPFLSKNFATTVSPWIVTLEALAPYRVPFTRPEGDPQPLPYLDSEANRAGGAFDVQLQVLLETGRMHAAGSEPAQLSATSYRHAYWTVAQLLAHHTVGGCNLQPGDLFGSGTLSGPTPDQAGALIELTSGGKEPLPLPDGDSRSYLVDGDTVIMRGWCEKPGFVRIGFGECRGTVLPAKQSRTGIPG